MKHLKSINNEWYACTYIRKCMHMCINIMHGCMYTYMRIYMYMYVCMCHICIYKNVYEICIYLFFFLFVPLTPFVRHSSTRASLSHTPHSEAMRTQPLPTSCRKTCHPLGRRLKQLQVHGREQHDCRKEMC